MAEDERFRNVSRFASTHGFAGGFPNFHEADNGSGVVYGTYLFSSGAVDFRNVRRSDLLNHDSEAGQIENVPAVARSVNRWATANGYSAGFPTFEQGMSGAGVVYGALLLRAGNSDWQNVPRDDLGAAIIEDVPAMMRGATDWASKKGYAAGFPTFEQADSGAGVVAGVSLLKASAVTWRNVYADVLALHSRFTFDAAFTAGQVSRLLERYSFAYERLVQCGNLTKQEKDDIRRAFRRAITNGISTNPRDNASAFVGGSHIDVNPGNFFGNSAQEQAQTLLHEMAHCAGHSHPDRRDCPPNSAPNCDIPFDNGPYYSTVPLRAEICIAGSQSDTFCDPGGDTPTIGLAPSPRIDAIEYDPEGKDVDREYLRIIHDGQTVVQLGGWTVADKVGHTFTFPAVQILPNESITLWTRKGVADARNLYWGRGQAVWNNDGDVATLQDGVGSVRSTYAYG